MSYISICKTVEVNNSPVKKKIKIKMQATRKFACHKIAFDSRLFLVSQPKHNLSQKIISHAVQKCPSWNFNLCHWRLAPHTPLMRISPPWVSFELLRLCVVDFSNNLHHQQTSGRGSSRGCWLSAKGHRSLSYHSLTPQHLGGSAPAPTAQQQEGKRPSPPPCRGIC